MTISSDRESTASTERGSDHVQEILCEVLERLDGGEDLEALLAEHADHADVLRRRLGHLSAVGLDRSRPVTVGPYRLERRLGRGGMGEVWLARHGEAGARVALKILDRGPTTPALESRFRREARALQRLDHPSIVRVHDSGLLERHAYIAMDFVEGSSLAAILRDVPVGVRQAVSWARDVARALQAAHEAGLLHRDVKPSNILVTPRGRAVLIDFGLTRAVGTETLSRSGEFVGSPHYASPEQVRGRSRAITASTDVYSLGVTLYRALAGRLPFESATMEGLFKKILADVPRPLRALNAAVPRDLEGVVARALEKRPEDRQPSAAAFADDLDAILAERRVRVRRPPVAVRLGRVARRHPAVWAAVAVAVVALLAFVAETVQERRAARDAARRDASSAVAEAAGLLDAWLDSSRGLADRIAAYERRSRVLETRYSSPDDVAWLNRELAQIEQAKSLGETVFTRVHESLHRALDLDPDVAGAGRLRARVYLERWRLARVDGSTRGVRFFADLVREHDDVGDLAAAVRPVQRVDITTDPPGARVDAFVYRRLDELREGGDPRLVPVPWRNASDEHVGRTMLDVRRGVGPLEPGDLIVEVDGPIVDVAAARRRAEAGGCSVVVLRDGGLLSMELPAGAVLRPTAAPLLRGADSLVATTPALAAGIEGEQAVLLVSLAGFETQRIPWPQGITSGARRDALHVTLRPGGRHPPAFIDAWSHHGTSMVVMDREVTCAEYLEFLNERAEHARHAPRRPAAWTVAPSGRLAWPEGVRGDHPVCGISWNDADAYARWRTARARAAGRPWRYVLPDIQRWRSSLRRDVLGRRFPWGDVFRAGWTKSCFAQPVVGIESGLSYPIDETITGLRDVAGGVSEFCGGWFWEERAERPLVGGSWVHADPTRFELRFFRGVTADEPLESCGFRLELIED